MTFSGFFKTSNNNRRSKFVESEIDGSVLEDYRKKWSPCIERIIKIAFDNFEESGCDLA